MKGPEMDSAAEETWSRLGRLGLLWSKKTGRYWHPPTQKKSVGLARFIQIFEKEMGKKTIQRIYNSYTKRLYGCRRAGGQ